ncbi:hypothetical protein [Kangiella sp.]|uniref:hypothetical protein n=1 Tax=Kangiella sp. TaxID=1920245 RepID=UPI0025BC8109|nr:hypothetical protein [Kangiella sp.]
MSLNNTAGQEVVISPYGEPFPKNNINKTSYKFIKIHDFKLLASVEIKNMNGLLKKALGEEFFYKDIYTIRLGADRGMYGYYWDLIVFVDEKPDYIYACLNNCHTDYREVFTIK